MPTFIKMVIALQGAAKSTATTLKKMRSRTAL
jgi:hypothetical protein